MASSPNSTSIFLSVSPSKLSDVAIILKSNNNENSNFNEESCNETILTNSDLLQSKNKGRVQIRGTYLRVNSSFRNASHSSSHDQTHPANHKLTIPSLLALAVPTSILIGCFSSFFLADASGWDAIFPSYATIDYVWKIAVWCTLVTLVAHEHSFYWYGSSQTRNGYGQEENIGVEVIVEHDTTPHRLNGGNEPRAMPRTSKRTLNPIISTSTSNGSSYEESETTIEVVNASKSFNSIADNNSSTQPPPSIMNSNSMISTGSSSVQQEENVATPNAINTVGSSASSQPPSPGQQESATEPNANQLRVLKPNHSPTDSVPFRFIRAEKGNISSAKKRWAQTLQWRADLGMDTILNEPHPNIKLIKDNYPHYFHLRGRKNECCYFERPPKMNLKVLKAAGIQLDDLLRHYALCTEYMWSAIDSNEDAKSIYVIDLEGIGFRDFAGEVVDFVKKASAFTAAHYPERSGSIFVINVPSWFSVIWNVVRPMIDDVTKKKISILKSGKDAILKALLEKIPIENIPPEYGGQSMSLGQSPEEKGIMHHFECLNKQQQDS